MILLAVVALGITLGMPKLLKNSTCFFSQPRRGSIVVSDHCLVDPEMRAEFEQHSRASPISGATNNAMAGGGFDLAGWMAGTSPGPMANADAAPQGVTGRDSSATARRRG